MSLGRPSFGFPRLLVDPIKEEASNDTITPAGTFVQTQSWPPGSFSLWTHIVATDNNLVFYNANTGLMAVGHIRFSGIWIQTDVFHMSEGCTSVVTSGQHVLCYNSGNGLEVMDIDRNGYALPKDVAQVGSGYDLVVRHGRDVVFYSKTDAGLQVGHVGDGGLWVATYSTQLFMDEFHPFTDANDVVSTGDALLIYKQQSGKSLVATVDREGQFHETQWLTLTTMWTDIVATTR